MGIILGELKDFVIEKVTSLPSDTKKYRVVGYNNELYQNNGTSYKRVIVDDSSPYFNNVSAYGNIAVSGTVDGRNIAADGVILDYLLSVSGGTTNHADLDNLAFADAGHTGFQAELVSGTNIKTINNESVLGLGNITVTAQAVTPSHDQLTNLDYASAGHTGFEIEGAAEAVSGTLADALTAHAAVTGNTVHGLGTASIHDFADFDEAGSASTVQTNLETHAATTGNTVHGLGTASIHAFEDFQEPLVSGTNIKTINTESILGSGDITISASGGTTPVYSGLTAYAGGGQANATQLNIGINEISTCATSLDSCKLTGTFSADDIIEVTNNGSYVSYIYPASGDNLGQGTDTPIALIPGNKLSFIGVTANSTWKLFGNQTQFSPQVSLTVTGSNWTTSRAVGVVSRTPSGVYRLKFNIVGSLSAGTTSFTGTISGVTFKNAGSYDPSISIGSDAANWTRAFVTRNASTFVASCGSNMSIIGVDGDVELNAMPTFI